MTRALVVLLVTTGAAAAFAVAAPGLAVRPGEPLPGHRANADDCFSCHAPLGGVPRERCVACHAPESIGSREATAPLAPPAGPRTAVRALHRRLGAAQCVACHAEHAGRFGGRRAARFAHAELPADLQDVCTTCHAETKPDGPLHASVTAECGACHQTAAWKPARFDHALRAADGPACVACHAGSRPSDALHTGLGPSAECGTCHATTAWKPSTFDHASKFRFDGDHPATCTNCHTPESGFRTYSCTAACHEHSPAKIAAKHRKEGITDVANCAKCHPSGDEDDIRRPDGGSRGGDRDGRGRGGRRRESGEDEDD